MKSTYTIILVLELNLGLLIAPEQDQTRSAVARNQVYINCKRSHACINLLQSN